MNSPQEIYLKVSPKAEVYKIQLCHETLCIIFGSLTSQVIILNAHFQTLSERLPLGVYW